MKIMSTVVLRHQSLSLVQTALSSYLRDTRSEVNSDVGLSEWECWPELEIGSEDLLAPEILP